MCHNHNADRAAGQRPRRGQMFTSDLAVSIFIFFVIVNIALLTWNTVYANKMLFDEERELRERVVRVSDFLVRTPGYPANWTNETVQVIGLVTEDHILDNTKLRELNDTPYRNQSSVLRATPHDFYLTVRNDTGVMVLSEPGEPDLRLEYGRPPNESADTVAVNERSVLVNSSNRLQRRTIRLAFWRWS